MQFDEDLARAMERRFGLRAAQVLAWSKGARPDELYERLGKAAAQMLASLLSPGTVVGVSWGTAVSATVEALEVPEPIAVKVVQLVGVLGSRSPTSNAQALTERLARKIGGQPFYLYAPFIVDSAHTARSLISNQNISDALEVARHCDVALLGIGTTDPGFCSLYRGGYISQDELRILRHAGAVGDVNAYHYDLDGHMTASVLRERIVGLPVDDLLAIPARLAVAGGLAKAEAVLGALRGGWINMLAIDSPTAERSGTLRFSTKRITAA